jgi:hypothetical protein
MLIRKLLVAAASVTVVAMASCSGGNASGGGGGGGVGSKCTQDSDCTGYAKPTCLTDLKPVASLVAPDSGAVGATFKDFDIPFPGGYCSNTIENSCQSDADCGAGGGCFRPLTGVSADVLASLDKVIKVFSVTSFASKGLCLVPCTSDAQCRTAEGYKCLLPLESVITAVNPMYPNKYCAQFVDSSYLLM